MIRCRSRTIVLGGGLGRRVIEHLPTVSRRLLSEVLFLAWLSVLPLFFCRAESVRGSNDIVHVMCSFQKHRQSFERANPARMCIRYSLLFPVPSRPLHFIHRFASSSRPPLARMRVRLIFATCTRPLCPHAAIYLLELGRKLLECLASMSAAVSYPGAAGNGGDSGGGDGGAYTELPDEYWVLIKGRSVSSLMGIVVGVLGIRGSQSLNSQTIKMYFVGLVMCAIVAMVIRIEVFVDIITGKVSVTMRPGALAKPLELTSRLLLIVGGWRRGCSKPPQATRELHILLYCTATYRAVQLRAARLSTTALH